MIERWRLDYNHVRPYSAHGALTPEAVRLNPAARRLRNLALRPTATAGAGDQLPTIIMIDGSKGDMSGCGMQG